MGAQAVTLVPVTDGTAPGDAISGTAKLGSFGDATFEGTRE
jgi:hypothetical protein